MSFKEKIVFMQSMFVIIKKEYDNHQFKNLEKVIGIYFASMKFLSSKAPPQISKGI